MQDNHQGNRQYNRRAVALPGQLRIEGTDKVFDCEIIDLSPGGAKINVDVQLKSGRLVFLQIGTLGEYAAGVAWTRDTLTGLTFQADPNEMAEVVMAAAMYG